MPDPIPFSTERPAPRKTLVVARDPDTGKSKSMTLYNVAPEDFIKWLSATVEKAAQPDPEPAGSAA
jgi:hypothetical protein